jgi:YbgC/YbaW family acyl-CoA thioester hydrolase
MDANDTEKNLEYFDYNMVIKEFHLDTFGHVNNAVYLQIYEEARWEMMASRGYGIEMIERTGLGPIILEIKINFLKELRLRKKIKIRTQLVEYHSKIGIIKQKILSEEGELCSEMEMKFGLFDTKTRKLVLPTEEWLIALGTNK